MKQISVSGKKREATGKKASKLLRKEGLIPCNLYGIANESISFAVAATDLRKVVYSPNVYVVDLTIDGEKHLAVMQELQFHPVTDALVHIDFLEVTAEKPIVIGIPVKLNGLAQGVRDGGKINLAVRKLNVKAVYTNIPETLEIDVTNLQLGKSIKVGQLHFEGLDIVTSPDVVVCSVKATRASRSAAAATDDSAAQ